MVQFSERCGNGVDFNGGDILLNGFLFRNKFCIVVMIVVWIKLFFVEGLNLLFDIIGGINLIYDNG